MFDTGGINFFFTVTDKQFNVLITKICKVWPGCRQQSSVQNLYSFNDNWIITVFQEKNLKTITSCIVINEVCTMMEQLVPQLVILPQQIQQLGSHWIQLKIQSQP